MTIRTTAVARIETSQRVTVRAAAALVVLLVALAGLAPRARAETPVQLDPHGVSVTAYGGWSAWSRADPATGRYALVTRSPRGAVSLPAVAERASPFDVELGPAHGSQVAAVYSRCTDAANLTGCHIFVLELAAAGATEHTLTPPGGGSDHEPALWDGRLVFLRRTPSGGTRRPDSILVWKVGSRTLQRLALPSSRGNRNAGWPAGLTGRISSLTFNGKQVGYATSNVVGTFGESSLRFEPLGGRPELIDQETGGAGNACTPEFVSPVLAGQWLYAYLHACDPTANPHLDRLTRYRHGEVQSATYTFVHAGDEAVSSAVLDGAAVEWDAYGIERLAHVSWRRIAPPVPQTFCSRSDPFC
ncbi:MAG: hypothetical protein JWN81_2933 [Solirubrobacterales bacterium]|nr:hypothetical protein [Solirubrobacterales bacterium]